MDNDHHLTPTVNLPTFVMNSIGMVYALPFAVGVIAWLITTTDLFIVNQNWVMLLILVLLALVLYRFDFSLWSSEATVDNFSSNRISLSPIVLWSAVLLFESAGVWVIVITAVITFLYHAFINRNVIWFALRELLLQLTGEVGGALLAISIYRSLGGSLPFMGLNSSILIPIVVASLVWIIWPYFILVPLNLYFNRHQFQNPNEGTGSRLAKIVLWLREMTLVGFMTMFAIFAAELFIQNPAYYLALIIGVWLLALLINQFDLRLARQEAEIQSLVKPEEMALALEEQASVFKEELFSQAYQAELYSQALAYEKMSQDLLVAGEIQNSFLPREVPELDGWQITVNLDPAMETSGDYYDFIELANGRLGLLVADVADKGIGPALYMAMSRTLIRTFAFAHDSEPERALAEANDRILLDTNSELFVTAFYAILDPKTGQLAYCNAGHNPPYLLSAKGELALHELTRTALPLGLFLENEIDQPWDCGFTQINPGDMLILYTDGIVEAQDEDEEFFGEEKFKQVALSNVGKSAEVVEGKVMRAVEKFVGDARQADDMTLMILVREEIKQ